MVKKEISFFGVSPKKISELKGNKFVGWGLYQKTFGIKSALNRNFSMVSLMMFLFLSFFSNAQIIFSEPFDEATGSTTGNDNVGGVSWSTACGGCVPTADYFEVKSGVLQCDDTNGPATWTTGNINVSSCTSGYLISLVINTAGATNPFEECVGGCGCNCVDWISLEYNANGAGYVPLSSVQGGTCTQGCSGGTYIMLGELSSGSAYTFSTCLPAATTLQLRISLQTWAQGEIYRIDDVTVQCASCVLPIELTSLMAEKKEGDILIKWITATEKNNDFFTVERTKDIEQMEIVSTLKGAGNSNKPLEYSLIDGNPLDGVSYYRIKQTDFNGEFSYSNWVAIDYNDISKLSVIPNPSSQFVEVSFNSSDILPVNLEILDLTGKVVYKKTEQAINVGVNRMNLDISGLSKGIYIMKLSGDGLNNYFTKLVKEEN